jgi:hypothetical protein
MKIRKNTGLIISIKQALFKSKINPQNHLFLAYRQTKLLFFPKYDNQKKFCFELKLKAILLRSKKTGFLN